MSSPKSRWKGRILAAAAAAAVCWAVMRSPQWRDFEWGAFAAGFRQLQWGWLLASVCCVFSAHALRAVRWVRLMSPIRRNARFAEVFSATVIGFGAVALLGRAGEFVRPYLVARRTGVPVAGQISIWFVERFLDLSIVLVLAGSAFVSLQRAADLELAAWARSAGRAMLGASAAVFAALFILPPFFDRFRLGALRLAQPLSEKFRDKLGVMLARFGEGLQGLRGFSNAARVLAASVVMWLVIWLAFDCMLRGCLPDRSFGVLQISAFMGLLMAGSVVQAPGIGGGIQVAAVAALTGLFGVDEEPAAVTAIVIWLTTFMLAAPLALALLARQGLSLRALRQLESENETRSSVS